MKIVWYSLAVVPGAFGGLGLLRSNESLIGARVNLQNRDGRTALTYAKALPVGTADEVRIRTSIIALLKKAGATE